MKKIQIIKSLAITAILSQIIGIPLSMAGYNFIPNNAGEKRQFNFELKPGEGKIDQAIIENNDEKELAVTLYGADATYNKQGSFTLVNKTSPQKSIGSWITFKENIIIVKPNEKRVIPFNVSIPSNTPPGNYAGGIAAEVSTPTLTVKTSQPGIISSRLILKVFVAVPGDKKVDFNWNEFNTIQSDTSDQFIFSYSNDGTVAISAEPWLEINGFPRSFNTTIKIPPTILMPGETVKIPYELAWNNSKNSHKKPFIGSFDIKASTIFSEYDVANDKYLNPKTVQKETHINIIPWLTIMIVALFTLLIMSIMALHVFLHKRMLKNTRSYSVGENDTITLIAAKCGVPWEKIAKLNRLKAPYALKKEQKLLIPKQK